MCTKGKGHRNSNKTGMLTPVQQCITSSSLYIIPQLYGRARGMGATCTNDTCLSVCNAHKYTLHNIHFTCTFNCFMTLEFPSLGFWLQLQQHLRMQNVLMTIPGEHKTHIAKSPIHQLKKKKKKDKNSILAENIKDLCSLKCKSRRHKHLYIKLQTNPFHWTSFLSSK